MSLDPGLRPIPRRTAASAAGAPSAAGEAEHSWMLVAPWWHWPTEGGHGRTTTPVFQKYETPDLVNTFLADPQQRLAFQTPTDQVVQVEPPTSLFSPPATTVTDVRKLYLDSHRRHYLVACELHCDITGFPSVARDQVCEAGFVIRRRTARLDHEHKREARRQLRRLAAARNRLAAVELQLLAHRARGATPGSGHDPTSGPSRGSSNPGRLKAAQLEAKRQAAAALVAEHQAAVAGWATSVGYHRQLEGWIPQGKDPDGTYVDLPACTSSTSGSAAPTPLHGVGRWEAVGETPAEITELVHPMHPLVADPTKPDSDATGSAIWFGLVPTGSSDIDPTGTARFDDQTTYEVRCYVRRHKAACPRTGPQCHCPITWSDPTEGYQVASHFDLQGTSNRPVTVQLPDLHQLQADALSMPPGSTGGLLLHAPQSLMPSGSSFPPSGSTGTTEICSFAIPLITIIATFVLKLFLPIVILAFQLWFMLALKFCIPPEASAGGGLDAALAAIPPSVDVSASVAASFESTWGAQMDAGIQMLMDDLSDHSGTSASSAFDAQADPLDRLRLARRLLAGPIQAVPSTDLVFAPRVERWHAVP